MLTTLMNEGANKWRKDKKRTYFLIDEAQKFCNHPDLWKRAEYVREKSWSRTKREREERENETRHSRFPGNNNRWLRLLVDVRTPACRSSPLFKGLTQATANPSQFFL